LETERLHARNVIRRSLLAVLFVGFAASLTVYAFNGFFHEVLLPWLGISSALGDALGSFLIICCASVSVVVVSYVSFHDTAFGLFRNVDELNRFNIKLKSDLSASEEIASTDRLTGIWNRNYFEEAAVIETDRADRHGRTLSMLMVDIDRFKSVNDTYGHATGDLVLKQVVLRLGEYLRSTDSLCRYGGEEFVVLCPDTALSTAVVLAERLRVNVGARPIEPAGVVTVSIGVTQYVPGEKWMPCLQRADTMLYQAKQGGRNQVQYCP
jgi:diguanylate cyclase (GGDEF)-like protein